MGAFIDKVKGRMKKIVGRAKGDRSLEVKGQVTETKGAVKGGFEEAKHDFKEATRREERSEQPRPH